MIKFLYDNFVGLFSPLTIQEVFCWLASLYLVIKFVFFFLDKLFKLRR